MGVLELKNITKKYDNKTVVDKFSAELKSNELITIVGPSGCGKTTTLRMIAGFINPSFGEIKMGKKELVNIEEKRFIEPEKREIGMVFQSYAVWPHMNVFKNVSYPLKIRKVQKKEMLSRTRKALELVHLDKYEKNYVHELSGGQQQRVALARALVMEPQLLLLDEPLSNLDTALRETMRSEIKDIQQKLNVTVINVTHDQIEAMTMSDKVIVMNEGRIEQIGSPEEIYTTPVNAFVASFIGAANLLECELIKQTEKYLNLKVLGQEIKVPNKKVNQEKGIFCVRPHHISIDNNSSLKVKIIRTLYQGDRIEYHTEVQNNELRILTDAKEKYKVGEIVGINFDEGIWLDK